MTRDASVVPWKGPAVFSAAYSPNGKEMAFACDDGAVRVVDAATRKVLKTLSGQGARVWSAAYSPDGKTIAAGIGDFSQSENTGQILLWDAATGTQKMKLEGVAKTVFAVAYSPTARPS